MQVLVTRAARGSSELAEHLRKLGAQPILIPAIELIEPSSFAALDTALAQLEHFHWLLFTSANAVEAFATRRNHLSPPVFAAGVQSAAWKDQQGAARIPSPLPPALKIAAVGSATAQALGNAGLTADLVPPQAVAESLTAALLPYARQADGTPTRFLLVRAEDAREHLPDTLRAAGADLTVAPAYRTVIPAGSRERLRELLADGQSPLDAITFTSSSTARNLLALSEAAGVQLPPSALRISIGPVTSRTLRELGLPPHAEAPEATIRSLAETVMAALRQT